MKKLAILIAEGDKTIGQDLKALLAGHGFEVIEAPERTGALRFFRNRKTGSRYHRIFGRQEGG